MPMRDIARGGRRPGHPVPPVPDQAGPGDRGVRRTGAKARGRLRRDFQLADLVIAHRGLHASSPAARLAASRRFAALTVQAFQAHA
ncbi:hypothetical protein [Kribbella sp. NPDC051137]|uniref:hypothetical protein n=1 Tax=Kribbella sp. NPDC051137 TaxID=3155045 RepID=UPI00342A1882